eukprot:253828-Rhodomonas_salina.1
MWSLLVRGAGGGREVGRRWAGGGAGAESRRLVRKSTERTTCFSAHCFSARSVITASVLGHGARSVLTASLPRHSFSTETSPQAPSSPSAQILSPPLPLSAGAARGCQAPLSESPSPQAPSLSPSLRVLPSESESSPPPLP